MLYDIYKNCLSHLKDTQKFRKLQDINYFSNKNSSFIDFSTNDYLNLSKSPELLQAGIEAGKKYGVGATGSRLLSGNCEIFTLLEKEIAKNKNTENSLYFSSGYLANFTTLSSLIDIKILKEKPIVFFDRLNHASLYQAIFLNKPELIRYEHNNINALSDSLKKFSNCNRPKFIVAETVFGMDGDILPIKEIVDLAKKYSALLYLDEAHATGILGNKGYGLSTTVNLNEIPSIVMGTFSKALGCSGGYIACNNLMKEFIVNKSGGFIYSTASSPIVAAIALKAWQMLPLLNSKAQKLLSLANFAKNKIQALGLNTGNSSTHIIPIILKSEELTLKAKSMLLKNNIIVSAVRPPTVPPNTSRLRIALTTQHSEQDINQLVESLSKL